jgi:DNA-binding SARP family transcriptional activator
VQQADGSPDADMAQRLYRQALSLYQGDYLEDNLYDDWCRDERERLRGLYLHALTAVARSALARGDAEEAAQHSLQALATDDCFETAYQLLIRAYLEQGNRVEALRVYERCAATLRQELDIDPMPETVALYDEIRHAPQRAHPAAG